jgi:hypothetical protein
MITTSPCSGAADRDTFLTLADLRARYGLGKTAVGNLVKRPSFPRPVAPGRWRLDHVLAAEDEVGSTARRGRLLGVDAATSVDERSAAPGADDDLVAPPKPRRSGAKRG